MQQFSADPIHRRSFRLLLTILLLIFAALAEAQGNRWTFRGPASTRATRVLIDPLVSTVLYAQIGGSLFRSLDAAATWQLMTDGLPSSAVVLVSPEAPNTLYARYNNTDGPSKIFKSSDGGATWLTLQTDLDARAPLACMAVAATTPATIYVGTAEVCTLLGGCTYTGGVFKSTNGGTRWKAAGLDGYSVLKLTPSPATSGLIYAMDLYDQEFFRSADGGGSWTVGRSPTTEWCPDCPLTADPVLPSTVYVGDRRGILKSTTGGASWTLSATGLPTLLLLTALVIDPADPSVIYAGDSESGVFQSKDGGSTWSEFTDGLTSCRPCKQCCQSVNSLAIDRTGNHLYAGTIAGVFEFDFTARAITKPQPRPASPRVVVPRR